MMMQNAYQDHMFQELHPHTEPCCDLKLLTRQPGRMKVGEMLDGAITRDDECHFTFLQNLLERKEDYPRNPHVFSGKYVNVVRKKDGELWLTFNRPRYSDKFSFQDLCREAAKELLTVASLIEKK